MVENFLKVVGIVEPSKLDYSCSECAEKNLTLTVLRRRNRDLEDELATFYFSTKAEIGMLRLERRAHFEQLIRAEHEVDVLRAKLQKRGEEK